MSTMTFVILLVAFFVIVKQRRNRWYRGWGPGPHHFPPQDGQPWTRRQVSTPQRADLESYVDSLETRIAQLEERLDFTERLVSGRKDPLDRKAQPISSETEDPPMEGYITRIRRDE
jgi:hypothetical protein